MTFYDKTKQVEFKPIGPLRLVQEADQYVSHLGFCDVQGCRERARKMYSDDTHKAFCLCPKHDEVKDA